MGQALESDILTALQTVSRHATGNPEYKDLDRARERLDEMHPNQSDLVRESATWLKKFNIFPGTSRASALRLGKALEQDLASLSSGKLGELETLNALRRTVRHVFIQEAAAGEYERQTGKRDPLRALMKDISATPGKIAFDALERQGANPKLLFEGASPQDLIAIATGAYDKLPPSKQAQIAVALEMPLKHAEAPDNAGKPLPVRNIIRKEYAHREAQSRSMQSTLGQRILASRATQFGSA